MSETAGGQGQVPTSEGPGSGGTPKVKPGGQRRPSRAAGGWRHRFSWRTPVAALVIILGRVLAPVSVLAVWTANQVSDTSRYVANVTPLIKDAAIQNALSNKITNEIVTKDQRGRADRSGGRRPVAEGLHRGSARCCVSGSLASGAQGFVHSRIHKIITGPRMAAAWVRTGWLARRWWRSCPAAAPARAPSASATARSPSTDLAPLEAVTKQDLVARGLMIVDKIPIVHATFALFPSKHLAKAQKPTGSSMT